MPRGTAEVDNAFLTEIEQWRANLARDIAKQNDHISSRQLNIAVQQIIDRIIFLRIAKDRGIETYGTLQAVRNGEGAYAKLCKIFRQADSRYNSGLFHFKKSPNVAEEVDTVSLKPKSLTGNAFTMIGSAGVESLICAFRG